MPKEIKQLIGAMDLDSPMEVIGKGFHRRARNVWFRGTAGNMRMENVSGNTEVVNPLLPDEGTNKTILRFYDSKNKRIIFGNYNSSGLHGIYIYNTISGIFQMIMQVDVNTTSNTMGFTSEVIYNVDILYGDSTQGDILFYIDGFGRPTKININRAIDGGYGTIIRSFLDVAKEPANTPPYVVYENDSTVTVNNLRKKLFRFKVRWVFDDNDKSVTSSQSEMPVPFSPFQTNVDSDPTINSRIAITFQTGASNVKKIELLASESKGNEMSDFFLITSLDKSVLNLPNNDISTYLFYNDKAYNFIDIDESDQLFDYAPQTAEAQTLLGGNVISYGNIKEGYPNLTDFTNGDEDESEINASQIAYYSGSYFTKLMAAQQSEFAFGAGNVHISIRGTILSLMGSLDTYIVKFTDTSDIRYTVVLGDDVSSVIEGLRVDALANGFTVISVGDNDLYISKTGISLAGTEISSVYGYNSILNGSFNAHDWWSKHGWGLVYFDEKERTNGVVFTDGFSVSSPPYGESGGFTQIPIFNAFIYHRPPLWATHYQWVRTKDLTKSKILQWISDRTLKDTNTSLGQDAYAYISIENLNTFISKNPGTPLGYSFSANDRIRFIKLFDGPFSFTQLYTNKDFEIVASVLNPTVNGIDYTGQFIKILLPDTDGSFGFGSSAFANYFIELYTPAQSVANGLDVYYEYGEKYTIGNAGTINAIHQGQLQNQSTDLSTPATFQFIKGDFYIRNRSIQTGQEITYAVTAGSGSDSDAGRITIGLTPTDISYSDPNINVGTSPYQNLIGFNLATNTTRQILDIVSGTYTFRIKGTLTIRFIGSLPGYSYEMFLQKNDGTKYQLVSPFDASQAGVYTFTFDTTFTMTTGERIFIFGWSLGGNDNDRSFEATSIVITRQDAFAQKCIDPNFSDYYPSAVNSNGRQFLFNPNANQVTFPTMVRWSLAYQEDTNINKTSRFFPENMDTVERSYGPIRLMRSWDRRLTIFQDRKCGQTGVYSKYIQDNAGGSQLITTDKIITANNISYYDGDFGVGNQPDSVVQSRYVYYFYDPILRKILRLSKDGITDLTELYKVQTWTGQEIPDYLNPGIYIYGGSQRVTGVFNIRPDNTGELLLLAQGTALVPGEAIAFDEARNSFYAFRDIDCDCMVCAENVLFYFINGVLWINNVNTNYANFFGAQKVPSIEIPFSDQEAIKKVYNSIAYQSNRTWFAPTKGDVITNTINSQTALQQESLIMEEDFDILEMPSRYAAFNRDQNSMNDEEVALWEGDYLVGNWILVKLSYTGTALTYLYAPYIIWEVNQRNF